MGQSNTLICCLIFLTIWQAAVNGTRVIRDDISGDLMCLCPGQSFGRDMMVGDFKSPNHPKNYCDNMDCHTEIEMNEQYAVMLIIETFATEARHDWLDISQIFHIDGKVQAVRMVRLTGAGHSNDGKRIVTAIGNGLRLHFHTDGSEHRWNGFRARFIRFNESSHQSACPPIFYEARTSAKDTLNGPERSLSSTATQCFFMINTTKGRSVQFKLKTMAYDGLISLFETEEMDALTPPNPIKTFNGLTFLTMSPSDRTVSSRGRSMLIRFDPQTRASFLAATDRSPRYFTAEFIDQQSPCHCPSEQLKVVPGGVQLTSPGFPQDYCDNLDCIYDLMGNNAFASGSTKSALRLKFNHFQLENNVDYVALYDMQTSHPRVLVAYTGSVGGDTVFTFDSYKAQVKLHTDMSVVRKGFNFTVNEISRQNGCQCGRRQPSEYSGQKGEINFEMASNRQGCNFADCFWTINDPETRDPARKHRIVMKIRYRLFRRNESIVIQNGFNSIREDGVPARPFPTEYKKYVAVPSMETDGMATETLEYNAVAGGVTVWFHSSWDTPRDRNGQPITVPDEDVRRLSIVYQWKERCLCGKRELEADIEWKRLSSADYPNHYCHNIKCNYTITAPFNHKILVNITDFQTESNEDFFSIYNGDDFSGDHIILASGLRKFENLLESENEQIFILFTTDVSISHSGWSLLYRAESKDRKEAAVEETEREEKEEEKQEEEKQQEKKRKEEEEKREEEERREESGRVDSGPADGMRQESSIPDYAQEKGSRPGLGSVLLLLLGLVVLMTVVLLLLNRSGRVSLGTRLDQLLGKRSATTISYTNDRTSNNRGYQPFAANSEMSLVNDEEDG